MPGIRTLVKDGLSCARVKTYLDPERAVKEATRVAARLTGIVNVTIMPVIGEYGITIGDIRYTAVFSCFSEPAPDISIVAHSGFMAHR